MGSDRGLEVPAPPESVTLVRGVQTWGTPKGHERREVPTPRFLLAELASSVTDRGRDELVFLDPLAAPCGHRATSGPR
ncbi:MAG: hypothetical protein ACT4PP_07265 [Sporichthyaceae bacterium]